MRAEESRVLVVAPFGQDAEAMAAMLRGEGVMAEACAGAGECLEGLEAGAGAVLLTEEALELPGAEELLESFKRQPAWSELPLIILTSGGESRFERLLEIAAEVAGGMTLLERPMREGTLLQTVRVALRSRGRQYQVRELLAERERAAEALRESEQRLRLGATAARLFAFEWDPIRNYVRRDGDAQSILGVPMKEETGESFFERIHPDDRERFVRVVSSLTAGQDVYRTSYRVMRPDGREAVLEESGRALFDDGGRFVRLIGMTADITARHRAEEALREERDFSTAVLETAGALVVVLDTGGRIKRFNKACAMLTGYAEEEVLGRPVWFFISPEDLAGVQQEWNTLSSGIRKSQHENHWMTRDGKRRLIAWSNTVLLGANGEVQHVIGTGLDISEQRGAEAELARYREELERLVAERTAKLQELVGELEHFSYTITHDLKSPLRAMRGFAEMASEVCGATEAGPFLEKISTSAERMDRLIADALNYSRAVRQELPLEDVDAGALLQGMLDSYPELQPNKACIRVEGRLPVVLANEAGLTQCFSNLLGNAVKFVKPGEKPDIRVWATEVLAHGRQSEWVRLWVEDKGIGIAKEMLPRVFEMFSRGSKDYDGTGIGLALVRKVAHRMGGKAGVESEEGGGSRFWIELKSGEALAALTRVTVQQPAGGGGGTVLYVEDEENDAMFMERAFAKEGLGEKLRLVGTGRAAIDYLSGSGEFGDREKYPVPSVVLLDLNLPQVSGFGVLEWIRNHPDYARLPVVVFSSSTREDDRTKARELGADEFVAKPSSGLEFGKVVERLKERWMRGKLKG